MHLLWTLIDVKFHKANSETVLTPADFRKEADIAGDLNPNQLVGQIAVQTTLEKAVFCCFFTEPDTVTNQAQTHTDGITYGLKLIQPCLTLLTALFGIGMLQPIMIGGKVEGAGTTGNG